jgi:undecaprenyl-diphosphatase
MSGRYEPAAKRRLFAGGRTFQAVELDHTTQVYRACHLIVMRPEFAMKAIRVPPTRVDREIADAIAEHTQPASEHLAEALTWGADEHLLIAAAAGFWLLARTRSRHQRRCSSHLLAASVVTGVLPHVLKYAFNQCRPDRLTAIGHIHGVPISGRASDAFPSGHALHMGALASAASVFPRPYRELTWAATVGLSLTRIVVLAHWTSDVVAGFSGGILIERLLRRWTGYGKGARRAD